MVGLFFGFLGSPYERDCSLRAPLESQTTNLPIVDVNCLPHQVVVWEFLGVSGNGRTMSALLRTVIQPKLGPICSQTTWTLQRSAKVMGVVHRPPVGGRYHVGFIFHLSRNEAIL